jgi:hypothetical protein
MDTAYCCKVINIVKGVIKIAQPMALGKCGKLVYSKKAEKKDH